MMAVLQAPLAFLETRRAARYLSSAAALARHQDELGRRLIATARATTRFYAGCDGRRLDEMPIVDKAAHVADFQAFNQPGLTAQRAWRIIGDEDRLPGYEVGTGSGTSGLRSPYIVSQTERYRWLGAILGRTLPDLISKRPRVAILMPGQSKLYQSANQSRILRLKHFDTRRGMEHFAADLPAFAPDVVVASPKALRAAVDANIAIVPKRVFVGSETLGAADLAILTRAHGIAPRQIYMATEGLYGASCARGHLHLAEDIAVFEFEALGSGLVTGLVTQLSRHVQPIIRYRLNDVLRLQPGPCPCGSIYRRAQVIGRRDDLIQLLKANGARVPLPPDEADVSLAESGLDDYRLGLGPGGDRLKLLVPMSTSDAVLADACRALMAVAARHGSRTRVDGARAALAWPFDRKLRRIAPLAPESL